MPEIIPLSNSWLTELYNGFLLPLGFPPLPPVQFKNFNRFQALIHTPSLESLAEDLEFNFSEDDRELLKDYDLELSKVNISILLCVLFFVVYLFHLVLSSEVIRRVLWWLYNYDSSMANPNLYLRLVLTLLTISIILFLAGEKIHKTNIIKSLDSIFTRYTESLALREIFYIVKELSKENVLRKYKSRIVLIKRIQFLAKVTGLIGLKYSREYQNSKEIIRYYQILAAEINEKARRLAKCESITRRDLDRYFRDLIPIYLTQEYGEFPLNNLEANEGEVDRRQRNWSDIKTTIDWIINTFSSIIDIILKLLKFK